MLILKTASLPSEKPLVPVTALSDGYPGTPGLCAQRVERAPRSAGVGAATRRTAECQRPATTRRPLREIIRGAREAT
jgi:hypothetical protein